MPPHPPAEAARLLRDLAARWRESTLGEKQAFQHWFLEFCDALGAARPSPNAVDDYCFEKPVHLQRTDWTDGVGRIDCWKAGHVAIEAKGSGGKGSSEIHLRKAFKQLSDYVAAEPATVPPYLIVVDVPRELIVWEGWRGGFGGFAAGKRIILDLLPDRPDDIALLQDILERPHVRDPRGKAQQVTREIAGKLAELAATFEDRGFESERVARFLMRCVFCFFAEDVGLLPPKLFERTLTTARETGDGAHVAAVLTSLWQTMDTGGMFGADRIQRFNGHFFRSLESLPLEPADVQLLIEAARFEWSAVEPSIFGTLLVRALEPAERHKLGAEYTPREYIERLVEPTVIEPIRERWTAVQARVAQLEEWDDIKPAGGARPERSVGVTRRKPAQQRAEAEAIQEIESFHTWLRGLRFLDPACGSGNFLYVTMALVKQVELEVLAELSRLRGGQGGLVLDEVHPRQFWGIEVNWWAREIAELTLWIGYHQFWRGAHGERAPKEPILEDTGTIECRDAILAWDEIVHRPEKDRPDPTPRIVHPVTGELVPDPEATLPYMEYVGARQAEWPAADFIVGNPPYLGQGRMREALGDGYVDALRGTYSMLPPSIDLVLYWWYRGALAVADGVTMRTGFITTNSIVQPMNRKALSLTRESGVEVIWAIPDHPWVDEQEGAAVRVSMTVQAESVGRARALKVMPGDILQQRTVSRLNADLTTTADVSTAVQTELLSNSGISHDGVKLHGVGFQLTRDEAEAISDGKLGEVKIIRPLIGGRELAQRTRDRFVIDFGLMEESEAREYPVAFDIVRARVKPQRDGNRRATYREYWWRFGEPRRDWREASAGLSRYIGTVDTSPHRYFVFLSGDVLVDDSIVQVASDSSWHLGVLSSRVHSTWSFVAGGRLGVGNDPRWNKSRCFDPFPFPDPSAPLRETIGNLAEKLDQHRKDAIARDERVTMTGMYNVVEKLRSGEALTPKERAIHEVAACGILKDMHDELDALVAEAYGWPWPMEREEILERLVALHAERVAEEARGQIRWLRPEYQIPRFAPERLDLPAAPVAVAAPGDAGPAPIPWPATAVEQLAALKALVERGAVTVAEACGAFVGADQALVARHLETLSMLGEVREEGGRFGGSPMRGGS